MNKTTLASEDSHTLASTVRLHEQLAALNDEQRTAVMLPVGPRLVLAGAGSGKTRVLIARIVQLVDVHGADPTRILAITFTTKAAAEMKTRLAGVLGHVARRVAVSTMHSASLRMLRRRPGMAVLTTGFKVADEARSRAYVAELLGGGAKVEDEVLKPAISALMRLKDEGVTPDEAVLRAWSEARTGQITPAEEAAVRLYPDYQAKLRQANEADFADLMLWPTIAMEQDDELRRTLAATFDHILVDERQDTNGVQVRWLALLARDHRSLYCVADDDQSIYGWRGAVVDSILQFEVAWPDGSIARLETNYRSTPTIVAASDALIAHNTRRLPKTRKAHAINPGEPIRIVSTQTVEHEAAVVSDELVRYLDGDEAATAYVLYRANHQSRAVEEALIERGLVFAVVGDVGFYRRREVLDALAYARLMEDPADRDAFARIANVPARGLGDRARTRIVAAAAKDVEQGGSLIAAANGLAGTGAFDRRAAAGARQLGKLADSWRDGGDGSTDGEGSHRLGDRLFGLLMDAGYLEMLDDEADGRGGERRTNLDELARVATIAGTVAALLDRAARGAASVDDAARLKLMTMHASKGLEADRVHLVGWREGTLPSKYAIEREAQGDARGVEEERRLAYVGLTRARSTAVVSHAREGTAPRSRFIAEIPARLREEQRAALAPKPGTSSDGPGTPPDGDEPGGPGNPARPSDRSPAGSLAMVPGEGEVLPVAEGHRAVAEVLLAAVDVAIAAGRDGSGWTMPWHDVSALPTNPHTGAPFGGSNVLTLWAAAARRGLTGANAAHYWASRSAWKKLGGELRPSAAAAEILMPVYHPCRERDHVKGHDRPIGADALDRKVPVLAGFRRWMVFNQADVAGAKLPSRGTASAFERIESAETAFKSYLADGGPALVHGGAAAFYEPGPDRVTMPPREAFAADRGAPPALAYYETLAHELAHSTGSRSRLRRTSLSRYGRDSRSRAIEELVAEIAAAMIGAALGISTHLRADHVDYVLFWRHVIADTPEALMGVVSDAERAARYVQDADFRRRLRLAAPSQAAARPERRGGGTKSGATAAAAD